MSLLSRSPLSLRDPGGQEEVPEDWRKANATPIYKKGQEGGPRELQDCQPHLHPLKGDGAAHSRGHHQASERKEGYQE